VRRLLLQEDVQFQQLFQTRLFEVDVEDYRQAAQLSSEQYQIEESDSLASFGYSKIEISCHC